MMKWWFIMITTFQHWRWPGLRKRKLPPLQLLVAPDNYCYDDDDDAAKFSPPPKQDHIMSLKIMAMMIKLAMVNPDYHWSLITTIMSKPLEIAMISKLMLGIEIEYDGATTNGMYEMLIKSSPKREPWSMTFDTGNQMKVKKQKKWTWIKLIKTSAARNEQAVKHLCWCQTWLFRITGGTVWKPCGGTYTSNIMLLSQSS